MTAVSDSSDSSGEGPGAQHDPVEIEWQFDALDLRPVERWLATLPTLAVETGDGGTVTALARTPRRLVDSYLDTDDWRIARAGFVVRTRRRGRHDEVTLKDTRPAEGSGLRQRLEVTEVLPASGLGALGPDGPVGRRLRAIVGTRRFREVLQVRTRRRPFALRVGGVDAAEVALDDTMIVVGNGQRPMQLRRVEVEVRPEWLEALEPIVEQLRALVRAPTGPALQVRGRVCWPSDRRSPARPTSVPPTISEESTMGDLAYAVLRRQLAVLRDKEPGTRLGEDPEELHDMRVATRRLRAALSLFAERPARRGPRCSVRSSAGWAACSARCATSTSNKRVWRDMTTATAGWSAGARPVNHDPLDELSALLEHERDAARGAMLSGLDSVRWERLAKGLAAMVQQGPTRRSVAARVPAVIGMPELVVARHEAVAKAAKRAKKSGVVSDFHRLRIRCKRLRYALEFSSERLRRPHRPLRPSAHRAPGRARADAGRRGGVGSGWPTSPPARPTCRRRPSS